jgi:hypothetical protein
MYLRRRPAWFVADEISARREMIFKEKMMRNFTLSVVLSLFLVGCAHVPNADEMAHADYGTYPWNYAEIVKAYFATAAVDPASVQYRAIGVPVQNMWGDRFSGVHFD